MNTSQTVYEEALKVYLDTSEDKAAGFASNRLALKITDNFYRILYLYNIHDNTQLRALMNAKDA